MDYKQVELRRETLFKDAVLSEAQARSMKIISQANAKSAEELRQAKEACEAVDHDQIAAHLSRSTEREYSAVAQNARRELLRERARLVGDMFAKIEQNLRDFTASENYGNWLAARLGECVCGADDQPVIILRPADKKYAQVLQSRLPGSSAIAQEDIHLGGLRLQAGNLLFDKTLDTALEIERQGFYKTSGLMV